jgi:hypothetical protein
LKITLRLCQTQFRTQRTNHKVYVQQYILFWDDVFASVEITIVDFAPILLEQIH